MNKARRKQLNKALEKLEKLEKAKEILSICEEEEQEYIDNTPDNLIESEKCMRAGDVVSELSGAVQAVEEAIDSTTEAVA